MSLWSLGEKAHIMVKEEGRGLWFKVAKGVESIRRQRLHILQLVKRLLVKLSDNNDCISFNEHRRIHRMSWRKMSRPKCKGGLGFRGFRDFNLALLGKHCWRLVTGDSSLLQEVLKSKYYPNTSFMVATVGHHPSYAWRSIMSARKLVQEGGRWILGNGSTTCIWKTEVTD